MLPCESVDCHAFHLLVAVNGRLPCFDIHTVLQVVVRIHERKFLAGQKLVNLHDLAWGALLLL
jgi:hypothetical protein